MIKLVISAFFLFATLLSPNVVLSGSPPPDPGNYGCVWIPVRGCRPGYQNCNSGYAVPNPNLCSGNSEVNCAGLTFQCVSQATNTCRNLNGHCVFSRVCVNGNPFSSSDCTLPGFKCCPNEPQENDPVGNSPGLIYCPGGGGSKGVDSAIGCIPIESSGGMAGFFLVWGLGIAGGIALILIVLAGYMITSSSGNPEKLKAGKELLASAVSGLALIIFSAYILRVIGLDILQVPGF